MSVYGVGYRKARAESFKRSGGICQFCGNVPAVEAHHWAEKYPSDEEISGDNLTALCLQCHEIATTFRRTVRMGGNRFVIINTIIRSISECSISPKSMESLRSSCTTGMRDLTSEVQSAVRSQLSRPKKDPTERTQTTTDSSSLNVKDPFGLRKRGKSRSRRMR